ncbi:MAG: hypothetical protein U0984_18975 [Prosthecobacter sp.]|nr:hypothetical protein [Prosthecobacter sp.]
MTILSLIGTFLSSTAWFLIAAQGWRWFWEDLPPKEPPRHRPVARILCVIIGLVFLAHGVYRTIQFMTER